MSLGSDIKEVYTEIGTAFLIVTESGESAGGYLDFELKAQDTKPFIRSSFLKAFFAYDTTVTPGTIIKFTQTDEPYLVVNIDPVIFENDVYEYEGVLYKCNVSGEIYYPSGEAGWSTSTYQKEEQFALRKSTVYGLIAENLIDSRLEQDESIGQVSTTDQVLYLPSSSNVQVMDRYVLYSGESDAEYYKIEVIEKRRFGHDKVYTCRLAEDTRKFP